MWIGHYKEFQSTPNLIPNVPLNIGQFICGCYHSLFLDSEGNVFSAGKNDFGQLGLGTYEDENKLVKIPIITPIKISCGNSCSYLLDFEGNVWSCGYNDRNQLGHIDRTLHAPKIMEWMTLNKYLMDLLGNTFLPKNSQNEIFATGNNDYGQLGTGNTDSDIIPREINAQSSFFWRDELHIRAKSARK